LGAIVSMRIAGQLADACSRSEYLMAIFHLAVAALLDRWLRSRLHMLWIVPWYMPCVFNPHTGDINRFRFANIPDATRDFPTIARAWDERWIGAGCRSPIFFPKGQTDQSPAAVCRRLSVGAGGPSVCFCAHPAIGKRASRSRFPGIKLRAIRRCGSSSPIKRCHHNRAGVSTTATWVVP